jgi:hypothetical protein
LINNSKSIVLFQKAGTTIPGLVMANRCATDLGFLNFICESTAMAVKVKPFDIELKIYFKNLGIRFKSFIITCNDKLLPENLMLNYITFIIA